MFKCTLCPGDNFEGADIGDDQSGLLVNCFELPDLLEAHLASEHFDCLPYLCEKCRFSKFPTEFSLRHHYESDHGLKRYYIRFEVSVEIDAKKKKIRDALNESIAMAERASHNPLKQNGTPRAPPPPLLERMPAANVTITLAPPTPFDQSEPIEHKAAVGSVARERSTFEQIQDDWPMSGSTNELLLKQIEQASSASHATFGLTPSTNTTADMNRQAEADITSAILCQLNTAPGSQPAQGTSPSALWNPMPTVASLSFSSVTENDAMTMQKPPSVGYLRCKKCDALVTNRQTSLNYHVNTRHFKYPLYECLHPNCGKQFHWLRNDALNHVLRKHGGDESLVRDNNYLYHGKVNAHRKEFFDTTARIMPEELASQGLPLPSRKNVFGNKLVTGTDNGQPHSFPIDSVSDNANSLGSFINEILGDASGKRQGSHAIVGTSSGSGKSPIQTLQQSALTMAIRARRPKAIQGRLHQSAAEGAKIEQSGSLRCIDCRQMVTGTKDWILLNHTNSRHLHLPVYRCRECGLPFEKYLRSYIVQHVRTAHNVADIDACIEDNRALYRSQLYGECVRLFRLDSTGTK